jgi:hypothetical protein
VTGSLGSTQDPTALVPGSVAAVQAAASDWARRAAQLESVAFELGTIVVDEEWDGKAAERASEIITMLAKEWGRSFNRFADGAAELETYASVLATAQGTAAAVIQEYARGEAATRAQKVKEAKAERESGQKPVIQPRSRPYDPGDSIRFQAAMNLSDARDSVEHAGNRAAAKLDELTNGVDFWKLAGMALNVQLQMALDGGVETLRQIVNGTLSAGNAMLQNPVNTIEMILGTWMMVAGSGGAIGGGGLTLTGVGAPVGVPIAAGSAALVGAGAALAGVGAVGLGSAMAGNSKVEPWKKEDRGDGRATDGTYADGNPGTSGKAAEKAALDEIAASENKVIVRDQVLSRVEGGNPNGRKYDGLWHKPDGTYEGYEVKSNSSQNSVQEANDAAVSYDNPARARLNGEEILITSVKKVRVFD